MKYNIDVMLDEGAYLPERAHILDAGMDLRSRENKVIYKHNSATFDTGVHMAITEGYVGFLKSKSGLNVNYGLRGEGVIDSGYTVIRTMRLREGIRSPRLSLFRCFSME